MSEAGMSGPTLAASYALLGLLDDGPRHGYDLARAFHDSDLGQAVRLEMSMLYNLLKRLERDGLITGQDLSGARHRRLFTLTEAGRSLFEQWLTTPVRKTREVRLDFLAKLYFTRRRGPEAVSRLFDAQLATSRASLDRLTDQRTALSQRLPPSAFERLVLDLRIAQNAAVIQWLEQCRTLSVDAPIP